MKGAEACQVAFPIACWPLRCARCARCCNRPSLIRFEVPSISFQDPRPTTCLQAASLRKMCLPLQVTRDTSKKEVNEEAFSPAPLFPSSSYCLPTGCPPARGELAAGHV